jgi:hypothetical protein
MSSLGNTQLPSASTPNNIISMFWDDLYPSSNVYYYGTSSEVIVQFNNVRPYSGTGTYTFQAILSSDGEILIQYLDMNGSVLGSTVGIENSDGTDGLQIAFNTAYLHDNHAILISDNPLPNYMKEVDPTYALVAPNDSVDVKVKVSSDSLSAGDYEEVLTFASNDPSQPIVEVTVLLHVNGESGIGIVGDAFVDFDTVFVTDTLVAEIELTNTGTDSLIISSFSNDSISFFTNVSYASIPAGESFKFNVFCSPERAELISDTLVLTNNTPTQPIFVIPLQVVGELPPVIEVNPDAFSVRLFTGDSLSHELIIDNSMGGSELNCEVSVATGELNGNTKAFNFPEHVIRDVTLDGSTINKSVLPAQLNLADLEGAHISFYSNLPGAIAADLRERNAVVSRTNSIHSQLLDTIDILYLDDDFNGIYSGYLDSIAQWVKEGGSVVLCADNNGSLTKINYLLNHFDLFEEAYSGYQDYLLTDVASHTITDSVFQVFSGAYGTYIVDSHNVAKPLIYDHMSQLHAVALESGSGRIVVAGNEIASIHNDNYDGQRFVNQIFDWLYMGGDYWLEVNSSSGTVSAGDSDTLQVTFDARGKLGGEYHSQIEIASNDPVNSRITIPAIMDVVGIANIEISPDTLNFGDVYNGYSDSVAFYFTNSGTDELLIDSIYSTNAVFEFTGNVKDTVPIGATLTNWLYYNPSSVQLDEGYLVVEHNDSSSLIDSIFILGNSVTAPMITVYPDSINENLFTGDSTSHQIVLGNAQAGSINLEYSLDWSYVASSSLLKSNHKSPIYPAKVETINSITSNNSTVEPLAGTYYGDSISFGITNYGSIMPLQFPIGNEHLQVGGYFSGYTISYWDSLSSSTVVAYHTHNNSNNINTISYTELVNDVNQVVVEVIVSTYNNVELHRTITFNKQGSRIDIENVIHNNNYGTISNVLFKSIYDFDVDNSYSNNNFDYDSSYNMIYGYNQNYLALSAQEYPAYRDLFGFNDYDIAFTTVDYTDGPLMNFDGCPLMHFELNDLDSGYSSRVIRTSLTAASNLSDLQRKVGVQRSNEWLNISPISGSVLANDSVTLDVLLDASSLFGGTYEAELNISSNDPSNEVVTIPVTLNVTGIPDIQIEQDTINFGEIFTNFIDSIALTIHNDGTETLVIDNVISNNGNFSTDVSSLEINPKTSRQIFILYSSSTPSADNGELAIYSNDADSPISTVLLMGSSVAPPVMEVTPLSISETLFIGDSTTAAVTISNTTGGSDLYYNIDIGLETGSGDSLYMQDVNVVFIGGTNYDLRSELIMNGASIYYTSSYYFDTILLDTMHIVAIDDEIGYLEYEHLEYLKRWVKRGGSLCIGSDYSYYASNINQIINEFNLNDSAYSSYQYESYFDNINEHFITQNVNAVAPYGYRFHVQDLDGTADVLVLDSYHNNFAVAKEVNQGKIVVLGDEIDNMNMYSYDNMLFFTQMFKWLAGSHNWLYVNNPEGIVPSGQSAIVEFTISAKDLGVGTYTKTVEINSNDPYNSSDSIIIDLEVIGRPAVSSDVTEVDFGTIYLPAISDTNSRRWIIISNSGTDSLLIDSIVGEGVFEVEPTLNVELAPGYSHWVQVTFIPTQYGEYTGELKVYSNDPVSNPYSVALYGEAVYPAHISVQENVSFDMLPDQIDTLNVEIRNLGSEALQIYSYNEVPNVSWLSIEGTSVIEGFSSAMAKLIFNSNGLSGSDYSTTLVIYSSDNNNSPSEVNIELNIMQNAPVIIYPMDTLIMSLESPIMSMDLDTIFHDPEGDDLTYAANSHNATIALSGVNASILNVSALSLGETQLDITATDIHGASNAMNLVLIVNQTDDIGTILSSKGMKIYPNPATNLVFAEYELLQRGDVSVHLYTADGRLESTLISELQEAKKQLIELDLSGYDAGLYFIRLEMNNKTISSTPILKE